MRTLAVFLSGVRAGTLVHDAHVTFAYDDEYLARPDPTPLSLSLPLRPGPHAQRVTLAWIQGLLPANPAVRRRLAERGGVKAGDPMALLGLAGLDCPGAVQVCPPDQAEAVAGQAGRLEPADEDWIAARLAALRVDDSDWLIEDGNWSLGGAQGKFPLRRRPEGGWQRAFGAEPTTHIVKPGVTGVRLLAANEHLCLRTLRRAGLPAAESRYLDFSGEAAVVVARFDRTTGPDGRVVRRHQEDLCQALGRVAAYERHGGPTARDILALLAVHAGEADRRRFVEALMANYLLGAPDGHARNYSLLLEGDAVALAPLYDVASALPYDIGAGQGPFHARRLAMAIAGEAGFGQVRRRHWARFFAANQVDPDWGFARLVELTAVLPEALAVEARELGRHEDLAERLVERVTRHCEWTRSDLV